MTVCAIVPSFNHYYGDSAGDTPFVKPFIAQLSERNPHMDIVLIDNYSTPPYPEAIAPNVEVMRLGRRVGYAVALNYGIRHCQCKGYDWHICMNNDCWIDPNEKAPVSHGRIEDVIASLDPRTVYGSGWNIDEKRHTRLQWSAWLCISREVLERVGLFDEALHAAFEDFDYQLRAQEAGYRLDTADLQIIHLNEHTRLEDKNYPDKWDKARLYFELKHGIGTTEKWLK